MTKGNFRVAFSFLVLLVMCGESFSVESAEEVYKAAKKYEKELAYYYEAKVAYQQLVQQYPNSSYADEAKLAAARTNILAMIRARDYTAIGGAIDNLIRDFNDNPELPQTLWRVARIYEQSDIFEYEQADMFVQAENLYRQIIQQYPAAEAARKAELDIRKVNIFKLMRSESVSTVQSAIDNMSKEFAGNSHLPMVFYDIARRYEQMGNFKQAKNFYSQVSELCPTQWMGRKARVDVRRLEIYELIESGRDAGEAINKLKSDFVNNKGWIADALTEFGRRIEHGGRYSQAKELYQQILQEYPNGGCAKILGIDIPRMEILALIDKGDYAGAEAAIGNLKSNFAGYSYLAFAINNIAEKYEKTGRYADAKNIHQQLIQQHPTPSYLWSADRSQMAVRRLDIFSSLDAGQDVDSKINSLMTEFSSSPHLASAVLKLAAGCRSRGNELLDKGDPNGAKRYFEKAAVMYEKVLNEFPATRFAAEGGYYAGDCYCKIDQYQKSSDCYQKTSDNYGGYRQAGHALLMAAQNYAKMKEEGLISGTEADTKIQAAYEQLIAKYPDCKSVRYAKKWLNGSSN